MESCLIINFAARGVSLLNMILTPALYTLFHYPILFTHNYSHFITKTLHLSHRIANIVSLMPYDTLRHSHDQFHIEVAANILQGSKREMTHP